MLRRVGGIVVGIALAVIVIMAIEAVGHWAVPLPPEVDPADPDVIAGLPLPGKAMVALAWFAGSLIGGLAANVIARRRWPAVVVAGFVLAGCVMTFVTIPHPALMVAIGLTLPVAGGVTAWQLTPGWQKNEEAAAG